MLHSDAPASISAALVSSSSQKKIVSPQEKNGVVSKLRKTSPTTVATATRTGRLSRQFNICFRLRVRLSRSRDKSCAGHRTRQHRLKSGAHLYLGISRCARPLPRGFTGHVAQPVRSIRNRMLAKRLAQISASGTIRFHRNQKDKLR